MSQGPSASRVKVLFAGSSRLRRETASVTWLIQPQANGLGHEVEVLDVLEARLGLSFGRYSTHETDE